MMYKLFRSSEICLSATVKVFISSTFTDTRVERDSFLLLVDGHLQSLARALGCEYEAIEMRWGISDEMTHSHLTTETCLRAIGKANAESDALSFLFISTDKYGYRDVPSRIDSTTMSTLLEHAGEHTDLLLQAYQQDLNDLDAAYFVQPLSSDTVPEDVVHKVLLEIGTAAGLSDLIEDLHKSVTFREVEKGILENPDAAQQAFCFQRDLANVTEPSNKDFFDNQASSVAHLRELVSDRLPRTRIEDYEVDYATLKASSKDLVPGVVGGFLWGAFAAGAAALIEAASSIQVLENSFMREYCSHIELCLEFCKHAIETEAVSAVLHDSQEILEYAGSSAPRIVGVYGDPGIGKSTVLALLARSLSSSLGVKVIYRHLVSYVGDSVAFMLSVSRHLEWLKAFERGSSSDEDEFDDDESGNVSWDAARSRFFAALRGHAPGSIVLIFDGLDCFDRPLSSFIPPLEGQALLFSAQESSVDEHSITWREMGASFTNKVHLTSMLEHHLHLARRHLTDSHMKHASEVLLASIAKGDGGWSATRTRALAKLAGGWTSWFDPSSDFTDPIVGIFERAEHFHGAYVVGAVASLLTVSRFGLSEKELLDILSIDDSILDTVYQYWDRPVRRCPKVVVEQVIDVFRPFLFHGAPQADSGARLYTWNSALLASVSRDRYMQDLDAELAIRQLLVDYFSGRYGEGKEYNGKMFARLINPQPLAYGFWESYNLRRAAEVPFQLMRLADWDAFVEHHGSVCMTEAQTSLSGGTLSEAIEMTQQYLRRQPTSSYAAAKSRLEAAYFASITDATPPDALQRLATLFLRMSWFDAAAKVQQKVVDLQEENAPGSLAQVKARFGLLLIAYRRGERTPQITESGSENIRRLEALIAESGEPSRSSIRLLAEMQATQAAMFLQEARSIRREGGSAEERTLLLETSLQLRIASLEHRERLFGAEHPETAKSLGGVSVTYRELRKYELALSSAERCLDIRESILARNDPAIALALENVHRAREALGKADDKALVQAFEITVNYYGYVHERVGRVLKALGEYFDRSGRFTESREVFLHAAEIFYRVRQANLGADEASLALSDKKDLIPITKRLSKLQERLLEDASEASAEVFHEWMSAAEASEQLISTLTTAVAPSYISLAVLLTLEDSPTGEPLSVADNIRCFVSSERPSAAKDPMSSRLASAVKGSLQREDLQALADSIPAPKANLNTTGGQQILLVSSHGAAVTRDASIMNSQPHVDFFAQSIAEVLQGASLLWDTTEILRSEQTMLPHPKSVDPNHLENGKELQSPFYGALGTWADANDNGMVVVCHGRKDWMESSSGARGAITLGFGALEKHRPDVCEGLKKAALESFQKAVGSDWVVNCDPSYAGRGGKSWTNLSNQYLSLAQPGATALDLSISRMFREQLVVDATLRERLAHALEETMQSI
ncbi:Kinesin light chain 3 [Hondaea fermentalgiana]|uniref:Kinesin light chain 3 n=1 Tax=Hondaea fermentalgiana TaxID=2315210 RepID=A0A2R5GWK4_9STRA|nr:Kinesin light chain 3 [Hondaea fermentalgiana]|eukprot:GBG34148.1 Kinesin light chain 3 [Hondaea fermentalgiana]